MNSNVSLFQMNPRAIMTELRYARACLHAYAITSYSHTLSHLFHWDGNRRVCGNVAYTTRHILCMEIKATRNSNLNHYQRTNSQTNTPFKASNRIAYTENYDYDTTYFQYICIINGNSMAIWRQVDRIGCRWKSSLDFPATLASAVNNLVHLC